MSLCGKAIWESLSPTAESGATTAASSNREKRLPAGFATEELRDVTSVCCLPPTAGGKQLAEMTSPNSENPTGSHSYPLLKAVSPLHCLSAAATSLSGAASSRQRGRGLQGGSSMLWKGLDPQSPPVDKPMPPMYHATLSLCHLKLLLFFFPVTASSFSHSLCHYCFFLFTTASSSSLPSLSIFPSLTFLALLIANFSEGMKM